MNRLNRIKAAVPFKQFQFIRPFITGPFVKLHEADRDWAVQVTEALVEAIDGLLDGLDANVDGRDGLSGRLWELRIKDARLALALLEE